MTIDPHQPRPRGAAGWLARSVAIVSVTALSAAACAAGPADPSGELDRTAEDLAGLRWEDVVAEAQGQTVDLWMWGGDERGNAYVDNVLAPAAQELGVSLRRVPVADTGDALQRLLTEQQAGREDGAVDLVWINGENFRTGAQADAWACGWATVLPNAAFLDPGDPVLTHDFGTPVDGCESPWHKAQFVLAYDSADVAEPPTTMAELFDWAKANPGRFTYPAPPDFTGSAFVRQALYSVAGGYENVPLDPDDARADDVAADLWAELADLSGSLWRGGDTYPRDVGQLDELFAGDQISFTMTYGPATLDALVAAGTLPATTRVLTLEGGTLGNASFLAIPANADDAAGAMVVADLALDPRQQLAKADPSSWGQYTVLDLDLIPADVAAEFAALPPSEVVPPFAILSAGSNPESAASWVARLEEGWRSSVLGR